jgi:hypothetical protein
MEKPIELTMVRAVPLDSSLAFCAMRVENKGESAITTKPQKIRNIKNTIPDPNLKIRGDIKQQMQDRSRERKAVFFRPIICDK